MATQITSVELPEHLYMHTETNINDNTIRTYTNETTGFVKMLAVFMSPEGRDDQIVTIDGGLTPFTNEFGDGPMSVYGQAFLNAKASADAGVTLQCLRITSDTAYYANRHIFIRYRVVPAVMDGEDPATVVTPAKMEVMFVPKTTSQLRNLSDLVRTAPAAETNLEDGWKEMRFMSVAALGRGVYGNNYKLRITNNFRVDKTSNYKNYYATLFKNTSQVWQQVVCIYPDAMVGQKPYYLETVVNDPNTGSTRFTIDINEAVLSTIYNEYKSQVDPETKLTELTFDPILGIDQTVKAVDGIGSSIKNFEIVDDAELHTINFTAITGFAFDGGSDGDFAIGAADTNERNTKINEAYAKAFSGETCRDILSRFRCPFDYTLDAGFDTTTVKSAIAKLSATRKEDFITYFDLGTDIPTLSSPYEMSEDLDKFANDWPYSIDAYYGQIRDPYNRKVVTVTSTYNLAINLPKLWKEHNGKHIPYAGSYGLIDTYIKNSVYPVYDESVDSVHLDNLKDQHINYAQINAKGQVIRANQDTRYPELGSAITVSNLTELNNCHIILDIKKDAEKIAADFMYKFNESSDLVTFNYRLDALTSKYAAAQVKSISAQLGRTDEEAELGIIHVNITVVHKSIVKIVKIDIDVNRGVE